MSEGLGDYCVRGKGLCGERSTCVLARAAGERREVLTTEICEARYRPDEVVAVIGECA